MTDKENRVEIYKLELLKSSSKATELQRKLEEGHRKGQARIAQLVAETEADCASLKGELERARIDVDKDRSYLKFAEADLERGFDK